MITHIERIKHLDVTIFMALGDKTAFEWAKKKCNVTTESKVEVEQLNGCCFCNLGYFGIYIARDATDIYETMFHECFHTTLNIMEFLRVDLNKSDEIAALIHGKICRKIMNIYEDGRGND